VVSGEKDEVEQNLRREGLFGDGRANRVNVRKPKGVRTEGGW